MEYFKFKVWNKEEQHFEDGHHCLIRHNGDIYNEEYDE